MIGAGYEQFSLPVRLPLYLNIPIDIILVYKGDVLAKNTAGHIPIDVGSDKYYFLKSTGGQFGKACSISISNR
jgi:hypothetical protein